MTLNGTMQFLNSGRLTEAGSLDLIDEDGENSDLEDRIDNTLPGSRRGGDLSTRRVRPEIRVTSIQFSPTANAFAAASTEGLLVYSVDDVFAFDPFDLDVDITPQSTLEALKQNEYLNAFVMAFRLNEEYLIHRVYEATPVTEIQLVSSNLPVVYLSRVLKFIGDLALESQHIEFNLLWINALLSAHGSHIYANKHIFGTAIRSVQRFIGRVAKDVVTAATDNKYAYKFLTTTDGKVFEEEQGANSDGFDNVDEGSDDEMLVASDEEAWQGFDQKVNNLALQEDGEESDDDELI